MSLESMFGIKHGRLVEVSGPTAKGDLILTVQNGDHRSSRPWGIPETDDQRSYANLIGWSNYSHAGYEMALSLGYWG